MERKKIHAEGPEFSRIITGAWRWSLPEQDVDRLIRQSLDVGMTTFDHADIYGDHGNEEIFGKRYAQRFVIAEANGDRDQMRDQISVEKETGELG
jgi:predicted oxidoreductase